MKSSFDTSLRRILHIHIYNFFGGFVLELDLNVCHTMHHVKLTFD
jgi:hypothetical protein